MGDGQGLAVLDLEREEHNAPGIGGQQLHLPRLGAGPLAHEPFDLSRGVQVRCRVGGTRPERALERLEMGLHRSHTRSRGDRALNPPSDLGRVLQGEIRGELQMQRDIDEPILLEDRDVVRLHHERLRQRDRQDPVAQVETAAARLHVHDHVAARQRPLDGRLDHVRGLVTLDHRLAGWDGHDDVGEVAPGGLAQAQPAELDVRAELGDRALGGLPRLHRGAVHQDVRVLDHEPRRGGADDGSDEQRGDRIALHEACVDEEQPDEDRERAGHVAGEVKRVGAQRCAAVGARCAPR